MSVCSPAGFPPSWPCLFATQRCKYDTCNCQNTEDCLCAALSSYARACAAKGIMLWGWREHVCSECRPARCPRALAGLRVTAVPRGSLPWESAVRVGVAAQGGAGGGDLAPSFYQPWAAGLAGRALEPWL